MSKRPAMLVNTAIIIVYSLWFPHFGITPREQTIEALYSGSLFHVTVEYKSFWCIMIFIDDISGIDVNMFVSGLSHWYWHFRYKYLSQLIAMSCFPI